MIRAILRGNKFQCLLIASINNDEDERLLIKVKVTKYDGKKYQTF